ncbi:MAG: helix-turn-helix domain-containing protein, partial [Ginsengibacter sp.]
VQLEDAAKNMLINYSWPGNVRQLKNMAEQLSVLSRGKEVTSEELTKYLPDNTRSRLPVLASAAFRDGVQTEFTNEREILYKLFFDVKKDVTELKRLLFEAVQNPAGLNNLKQYQSEPVMQEVYKNSLSSSQPVLWNNNTNNNNGNTHESDINDHQEIEESLSIVDAEKDLIVKALKKHRGKRKDASSDLGISERTLYRKLKEYDINE